MPIPNRNVGPQALRYLFRQPLPAGPQSALSSGSVSTSVAVGLTATGQVVHTLEPLDFHDAAATRAALVSSDPIAAARAARELATIEQHPSTDYVVKMYTNTYGVAGEVDDRISMQVAWPREGVPTGNLVLKGAHHLAELALTCEQTVVPITVEVVNHNGDIALRWSGRIDVAHDNFGDPTTADTVECELLHDKAWLTRILCWPNYLLPIQAQAGSVNGIPWGNNQAVFIGNAIICIKTLIAEQAWRIQSGLWEMFNNALSFPPNLDIRAWFGTMLMRSDGGLTFQDFMQSLSTPIYVVPTNPIFDTSPFVTFHGRMDEILSLINDTVKDNGLTVEVNLWLPGDPQPDPQAEALQLLHNPTIVVDVKDRMAVTGFSGTFLDGIERDLVDLLGSTFGEVLAPFLDPNNEAASAPEGVNIAPLLGQHFIKPWCLFTDHPRGRLKGKVSHHHPLAYTTITGGKSPKWMNDLINATLEWLIDSLMIVIGFTGVPGSIFDGMFNDIFLAFQLTENFSRRLKLGPYGFPEKFFPTGSGSYTLDAFFAQKAAQWDTRGWVSGQCEFENGYPYELGRDIFPGALATYVRRGKLFTDFVENAVLTEDRNVRSLKIQIGDGRSEDAPVTKIQRKLVSAVEAVNILTMSAQ